MRRAVAFLGPLFPLLALAEPAPVIGGGDSPAGKWPDCAAMYYPTGDQGCTGTLIAPTVAITAGHCIYDGGPSAILVGTNSLAKRAEGEFLPVMKRVPYPASQSSYDISVLVLGQPSRITPRPCDRLPKSSLRPTGPLCESPRRCVAPSSSSVPCSRSWHSPSRHR